MKTETHRKETILFPSESRTAGVNSLSALSGCLHQLNLSPLFVCKGIYVQKLFLMILFCHFKLHVISSVDLHNDTQECHWTNLLRCVELFFVCVVLCCDVMCCFALYCILFYSILFYCFYCVVL